MEHTHTFFEKDLCKHGNDPTACERCREGHIVGAVLKDDGTYDYSKALRIVDTEPDENPYEYQTGDVCTELMFAHELNKPYTKRREYSLEDAGREKPYTHYSHTGNIFQILRFGVQSNSFKNRFNALRNGDKTLERMGKQLNGIRSTGASYQEKDGISLSVYDPELYAPSDRIVFLIDPDIYTLGAGPEERDVQLGYGHGIPTQLIDGEYEAGNKTAYKTEVIGINVIPPSDIRGVVLTKNQRILFELSASLRNTISLYLKERNKKPRISEDVLADIRLLGSLSEDTRVEVEAIKLERELHGLNSQQAREKIVALFKDALKSFVGSDTPTEEALRTKIEQTFGVSFLIKD